MSVLPVHNLHAKLLTALLVELIMKVLNAIYAMWLIIKRLEHLMFLLFHARIMVQAQIPVINHALLAQKIIKIKNVLCVFQAMHLK